MSILKQMAPFGPDNQRPMFEANDVYVVNSLATFKEPAPAIYCPAEGRQLVFSSVGFDLIAHYEKLKEGRSFQMAFTIEENTFNGNTSIQLRIKDIKFA